MSEFAEKIYLKRPGSKEPEETGWYTTDHGALFYKSGFCGGWFESENSIDDKVFPDWYYKEYFPEIEAIEFAKWMLINDGKIQVFQSGNKNLYAYEGWPVSTKELYEKFKQETE